MLHCPYKFGVYLEEYNILICRPKGELTADRVNDIAICRECIQKAGFAQVYRFHNLTQITSVNIGFEEVRKICDAESRARDTDQPIKACYLVPNPLLYGIIRMYQVLIESCGVEVYVSYEIDELAKILGVAASVLTYSQKE
jgi:hypothetical protein